MKKEGGEKRDQEGTHYDAKYFSRKKELNEVPVCKWRQTFSNLAGISFSLGKESLNQGKKGEIVCHSQWVLILTVLISPGNPFLSFAPLLLLLFHLFTQIRVVWGRHGWVKDTRCPFSFFATSSSSFSDSEEIIFFCSITPWVLGKSWLFCTFNY